MTNKIYDSQKLFKKDVASILELDPSQVGRLFREGRIKSYEDDNTKKNFTHEADLIDYLSARLPSGFGAYVEDNLTDT